MLRILNVNMGFALGLGGEKGEDMVGIYVIADADGRVYYVGKSKQIEKRAKQHLREMSRDEDDWRKNKMYWILDRMYYTQPMDLGLYVKKS